MHTPGPPKYKSWFNILGRSNYFILGLPRVCSLSVKPPERSLFINLSDVHNLLGIQKFVFRTAWYRALTISLCTVDARYIYTIYVVCRPDPPKRKSLKCSTSPKIIIVSLFFFFGCCFATVSYFLFFSYVQSTSVWLTADNVATVNWYLWQRLMVCLDYRNQGGDGDWLNYFHKMKKIVIDCFINYFYSY